ncbi:MAG TPA: hypothetical protein VKV16_00245, partial [Solirubrobacteraceae bacterium]|nr:hypothetical protein [Solirubrobacteraceae bacterium]
MCARSASGNESRASRSRSSSCVPRGARLSTLAGLWLAAAMLALMALGSAPAQASEAKVTVDPAEV